ncbi:5-amino-6-(5-phosphoribosylamino)uracil reductase [Synechococcus sp. BIOS-E4-1]|uniref:RibD family protein n=1 Tax=Synechococcus sp. BIOS-E4-1 TaxID=1400864 RepID=UPI001645A836|nr:RibD family protein [Synechococcus sp. BIOS-E4-1]QNI56524.1 5-amino-6-(5-phosphoribosylamino)uracil reductase [Synechococcus sp. BIOS-E4-1]
MAEQPTLRLVLAVSLDGRLAPPRGGAAQLGGSGDRRVLEEALAWSDAVLIGAGTLRAHQSSCLIRDQDLLNERRFQGRSPQPAALVVSRQAGFPLEWPFFQQPFERHLLSVSDGSAPGFQSCCRLSSRWSQTLQNLRAKGWFRLVLLGGAVLTHSLLVQDAVDELQLTLSPRLLGGSFTWLLQTETALPASLTSSQAWSLMDARSLGDNELLVHYCRNRSSSS